MGWDRPAWYGVLPRLRVSHHAKANISVVDKRMRTDESPSSPPPRPPPPPLR